MRKTATYPLFNPFISIPNGQNTKVYWTRIEIVYYNSNSDKSFTLITSITLDTKDYIKITYKLFIKIIYKICFQQPQ